MLEVLINFLEHPLFKSFWAWIILFLSYAFWSFDVVLQAMVFAVLTDFILGFSIAVWEWKYDKVKFMNGLKKQIMFAFALVIGNLADLLIFHQAMEWWVQNFLIVYIGLNELISSLKHLSHLGFRIPAKLLERLEAQSENIKF
jgi:phage-related holin